MPRPQFDLPPEEVIFGSSAAMKKVRLELGLISTADVPVLIQGPSGTGKDIIARIIHGSSKCAQGPYQKVNCPAIPDALLESELFGYEKGAFTGATAAKPGLIAQANRGTLFLDEISELSLGTQAKLLQVLQDGKFCRIGAQEDTRSEARVICATNRDLRREIAAGNFREDLFFRVNVVTISLPALRERRADIPMLAEYFREHFNAVYHRRAPSLSGSLMQGLEAYHWPGNIRQLENLMKRYVVLGTEASIADDLTETAPSLPGFEPELPDNGPISLKELTRDAVRQLERRIILKVLQRNHWNRRRTAKMLKISYRALLYKIQEAGLGRSPESPQSRGIAGIGGRRSADGCSQTPSIESWSPEPSVPPR